MDKSWYRILRSKSSIVDKSEKLAAPDEANSRKLNGQTPNPSSIASATNPHLTPNSKIQKKKNKMADAPASPVIQPEPSSQSPKLEPNRPKFLPTFWPLGRGGNTGPPPNTSAAEDGKFEVSGRYRSSSASYLESKKFNPVEALWSDPSLIQTGESLLSVMMSSHDSMKPIPIQ
jgi:hypothetical protein